ncbi:hypothetical protein [Serratia fonticola]
MKSTAKKLDAKKLYENAVVSIQLGIEDFKLSQLPESDGGNPFRALSSVRNLYAGLLLLCKYKIATSVDTDELAYELIHCPPQKILPHPDGRGGVIWQPEGRFKKATIDVAEIKERFANFEITVDWHIVEKLQECRNHLEHLHPNNSLGEVAEFVADLFPVLRDFITNELNEVPQTVLGSAWETMLQHKKFFSQQLFNSQSSWDDAKIPAGMTEFLDRCSCPECGSKLLEASHVNLTAGETVSDDELLFNFVCVACGENELIAPLLIDALQREYFYWPPEGEEPTYEMCYQCEHETFLISEQNCRWCGYTLECKSCSLCGELLTQDEQDNGGLCSYHNYIASKYDMDS